MELEERTVEQLPERCQNCGATLTDAEKQTALEKLNGLRMPLSREVEAREGEVQAFSPAIDALYVPDIDRSLDEEGAKQRFWQAFRMLGRWYDELPPY